MRVRVGAIIAREVVLLQGDRRAARPRRRRAAPQVRPSGAGPARRGPAAVAGAASRNARDGETVGGRSSRSDARDRSEGAPTHEAIRESVLGPTAAPPTRNGHLSPRKARPSKNATTFVTTSFATTAHEITATGVTNSPPRPRRRAEGPSMTLSRRTRDSGGHGTRGGDRGLGAARGARRSRSSCGS